MYEFIVDPYILTAIKCDSFDRTETWKRSLEDWVSLSGDGLEIKSCPECVSELENIGALLNFQSLRELNNRCQLNINVSKVLEHVRKWASTPIQLDRDSSGIGSVVYPNEVISRNQGSAGLLFGKALEGMAIGLQIKTKRPRELMIPVVLSARVQEGQPKIVVSLPLEQSSALSKSKSNKPELGTPMCLDMLGSIPDIRALDPTEAFRVGEKLFRRFLEESARANIAEVPRVSFHKELLVRISESRIDSHGGDFREFVSACIHVLDNTADRKEFRESENSPVQETRRGNWKAWRVHITKRGAGWRLNYWERRVDQGREVEFAWIEKKNERPRIPR